MSQPSGWEENVRTARKIRDDSLAQTPGGSPQVSAQLLNGLNATVVPEKVLSLDDIKITALDTEQLLSLLASAELSSVTVIEAFMRRAALAQQLTNCVTEVLSERALARARELDVYLKNVGNPIGPLHGLPISVKEHLGFKGHTLNGGSCSLVNVVAETDATIVQYLERAGANCFVRTTEPQTLMHLETSSNLFGITTNSHNRNLTSGGSSGGEGALIGLRGSVLGVGSDIGGSIRSPAANNGIYGLKPSCDRLPIGGSTYAMIGNEQIKGTFGPLSTSLYGLKILMKSVIDRAPWISEQELQPLAWKEWTEPFTTSRKLKVAVMWDDGIVKPHPPVTRALREVLDKLQRDPTIEVTEWSPWKHDYAWDVISRLYFTDGGKAERDILAASGEPYMELSKFILDEQPGVRMMNASEIWALTNERDTYRAAYNNKWNATGTGTDELGNPSGTVDIILCPAGPGAAPPLNCSRYWCYTSQWNLLDYPALVFPVTEVDQTKDKVEASYVPANKEDKYNYDLYTPERYRDAPVSLQLVARRLQEEKLLAALEHMQKAF